ncbi:uncharacterized protein LOC110869169 isoform X2 [Helianthus annuus]|uniref:uncharacterized protein LOC110869169 isoform X2 n=1 Tax=Helianthus annuus TaxID=4232 RepID=UPI000B8F4717|nr:uncharacterized protein LOC110869169 isoform X2 [Helianthus annuus]
MVDTGGWPKYENEGLGVTSLENEDCSCAAGFPFFGAGTFAGSAKNAYRLLVGSFDFHLHGGIRCLLFVHLMADTGGWEKHENEGLAVTSLEYEDRRCADEGSSKQEDYLKTKCSCLAIS